MMMGRLIVVLNWTKEAVDHHGGDEVINSFISDSWAVSEDLLFNLEKELNPLLNKDAHDQNDGRTIPLDEEEFHYRLKIIYNLLLQWDKERMLPRVVQQSSLSVATDKVVRVVERSEPVEPIAERSGNRMIELVYKDDDPPEGVENPTFLYCMEGKGRVEEFFTCPVPVGAVKTSPIHLPQEEDEAAAPGL